MSIYGRPFPYRIESSKRTPQEIAELLKPQIADINKGDTFLLLTYLIEEHQRLWDSREPRAHEDGITPHYYLANAAKGGESFLETTEDCLRLISEQFIEYNSQEQGQTPVQGSIQLSWRWSPSGFLSRSKTVRFTDPGIPIPYEVHRNANLRELEIYPFQIVVGHEAIEQFIAKREDGLRMFYAIARRIFNLPLCTPDARILDAKLIQGTVLEMYEKWQELLKLDVKIDRTMSLPEHDGRFDKVAAVLISSVDRGERKRIAKFLHARATWLEHLNVLTENLVFSVTDTPGLKLDVSEFTLSIKKMFQDVN